MSTAVRGHTPALCTKVPLPGQAPGIQVESSPMNPNELRANIYDYTLESLEIWFADRGMPPFRGRQVFRHVHSRGITDPKDMTDLPKDLRETLAEVFEFTPLAQTKTLQDEKGDATKVLWQLPDGKEIESVYMVAPYRETICFSTQVGCAFGCKFCITAKMGRLRNLSPGEIVAQVHNLYHARANTKTSINLVAMGMGEPMDNLDNLLPAIDIISHPMGLNISPKRITISTVGVVPGILRLAEERPHLPLALSLNATTDDVRVQLMPVNKKYPLAQVVDAVRRYASKSKHRVTLEYVLIKDLNDTPQDADRLGDIAEQFPSKVNVIPFNPSDLMPYERPDAEAVNAFAVRLWERNTTVTVRYSKGVDIQAACGQLGYDQVKARTAV